MKPISRKWLPQTITLFNLWPDPDTGEAAHYRTFLEGVRVDSRKTTLAASTRGYTESYQSMVFIDPVSTSGYSRGADGGETGKDYLAYADWCDLPAEDKAKYWTLNGGDWLVFKPGEQATEAPDLDGSGLTEQEYRNTHGVRVIATIPAIIDKDGAIHHWEVELD